jgi:hypothetical protein
VRPKPELSISNDVRAGEGIAALTVDSAAYGMRVTCTIGPHPGFSRLVIRYRIDGRTPSTPADGLPLLDAQAVADTTYRGYHDPRHQGRDCFYTAFGIDERGSIRTTVTTVGRPSCG